MIFISHISNPDHEAAKRIAEILKDNGISCWIAPESIEGGNDFAVAIPKAINTCEIFLLILSKNTARSAHVRKELMLAISHRKKIIPLRIDDCDIDDVYEYLCADIQIVNFDFSETDIQKLVDLCKLGERVVEMEISKNPRRKFVLIRGDFEANMDYMIHERPEELADTVFAMGIDRSSRIDISSNRGILKWVMAYLHREYGITAKQLQLLINQAKMDQLGHEKPDQELEFKDAVMINLPLSKHEEQTETKILRLLLVANSQKKESYYESNDVDEVEGIDSREIIISVFNKLKEDDHEATNLFIGAMGTNGLAFPYEVITSEILNCYVYAQRLNCNPVNLYYSVRTIDMERAGLTVDEILSYISQVINFFKD